MGKSRRSGGVSDAEPGHPAECRSCGQKFTQTVSGRCPNNNCPTNAVTVEQEQPAEDA